MIATKVDELTQQIDDICKALEEASFEMAKYRYSIVREFIDTIKMVDQMSCSLFLKAALR